MSENLPPPSLMVRKFIEYSKNLGGVISKPNANVSFSETWYFFYGTLMDPKTLMDVLRRPERPELYPASVYGHKAMLWGGYPAAVFGGQEAILQGVACKIKSEVEANRLESYEGDMYRVRGCTMWLQDGTELAGRMFVWNQDTSVLRDGNFVLEDWLAKHHSTRA